MKVIIAPDSFKESLSAKQVCIAIRNGLQRVWPDADYVEVPIADGGEGTVQSLVDATAGRIHQLGVTGPVGERVDGFYGLLGDGETAVIEMAAASGLHHVPREKRDPKLTTSLGTGELILDALNNGARRFIIGLGGSATNDGGIGMLSALGAVFSDQQGQSISANGLGLSQLAHIDTRAMDPRLNESRFLVACDVDNPLCGNQGASAVFGPQKGATDADIQLLDTALFRYAKLIKASRGIDVLHTPGAGAAGGMGAALLGFLPAQLKPGVEIVLDSLALTDRLNGADLVITGEGRIDGQTIHGKAPIGVARVAKQAGLPVIAIAGCTGDHYQAVYQHGIDAVFSSVPRAMALNEAFLQSADNLADIAENVARLYQLHLV